MVDYLKVFGANLRQERQRRGLTQGQLAKRIGRMTTPYVSRVERGTRNISVEQCLRFSHAVGMPLDAMFDPKGVE